MKNINLSVTDRLQMPILFPKESDMITMVILKAIKDKVDFTLDLISEINLRQSEDKTGFLWDKEIEDGEISFSDAEIKVLNSCIDRLDAEKKITIGILDLCEKIRGN